MADSKFYSACPPCEFSWQALPGAVGGEETVIKAAGISDAFVSWVSGQGATDVDLYCPDSLSWGSSSEKLRTTEKERNAYLKFAQDRLADKKVEARCTQSTLLTNGLVRVMSYLSVDDACDRLSLTIDTTNSCIRMAYASAVPDDPEALRQVDFDNQMPWQNGTTVDMAGPAVKPSTAKGSCEACDPKFSTEDGLTEEQVDRALNGAKAAWVTALLENDASTIADSYCENGNLWGTVTAMRRNTRDEIQSYFDWFANSRNFTEAIRTTCSTITKIGEGALVVSLELNLEGQCLRMQFTMIEDENGAQCVAALDSSYVPATPQLLADFDAGSSGSLGFVPGWLSVTIAAAISMMI